MISHEDETMFEWGYNKTQSTSISPIPQNLCKNHYLLVIIIVSIIHFWCKLTWITFE